MPDFFDPYAEWLGIRDPERPPNYYRLLGLDEFEDRRDRIVAAADRMMAQVRRIRPGSQAALWQRMLDELAMAKQCLTDPVRKAEYDGQLHAREAGWQPAPRELHVEVPAPNPDLFPPTYRGDTAGQERRRDEAKEVAQPQATDNTSQLPSPKPSYAAPIAPAYQTPYAAPVASAPTQQPVANPPMYSAPIAPPAQQQPAYGQPPYVAPVASPVYPQAPYVAPVNPAPLPVYGATAMPGYPPGYQTPYPATPVVAPQYGAPAYGAPAPGFGISPATHAQPYTALAPVVVPNYQPQAAEPSPLAASARATPRVEVSKSTEDEFDSFPSASEPGAQTKAEESPPKGSASPVGKPTFRPIAMGPAVGSSALQGSPSPLELLGRPRARSNQNLMIVGVLGGLALLSVALIAMLLSGGDQDESELAHRPVALRPEPATSPVQPLPEITAPPSKTKPSQPVVINRRRPEPKRPVEPRPEPSPVATVVPKPVPKPVVKPEPQPEVKPEPKPSEPKPEPALPPKSEPAANSADRAVAFNRAIRNARLAMSARDTERGKTELEKAAAAASTTEQQMLLERTQTLNTYVAEFWDAVRKTLMSLQVADVITIGSTMAAVVEVGPDMLTIHVAGGNKSYTKTTMPVGVARAMAERWFDAKNPTTKVFLGAFQAVDPNGDTKEARRLWEEATLAGATADDLIPLLDMDVSSIAIEQGPAPSESDVTAGEALVRKKFQQDLNPSFSPQKKLQVSKKLAEAAAEAETSAERFALFRKSVELAVEIGNAAGAVQTIDEMAKWFKIDALGMKATALLKCSELANTSLVAKGITRAALELMDEAMAEQQKAHAQKLAQAALNAANKSKDGELIKQATERSEQVKAL